MTVIRTERLVLRPFTLDDVDDYATIRRQQGLTRFLPSHTEDRAESDRIAAQIVEGFAGLWEDPGYGPWAVVHADQLIGHAGLRWVESEGSTEVLYLFAPAAHGQGFATEAARAALGYGFDVLGLDRIVAWAMEENTASLAVMQRLGMQRTPGLVTVFGVEAVEYWIARNFTGGRR